MTETVEARAVRVAAESEVLMDTNFAIAPATRSEAISVVVEPITTASTTFSSAREAARDVALLALMEYTNERGKHGDHSF